MRNKIFIVFLVAFLVRLVLIVLTSQSLYEHNDSYLQRDWGRVSFLYGFADTYNKEHISDVGAVNNLPPGATYIFGTAYYFHVQVSKLINLLLQRPPGTLLWMNDGTFANMFLRLPAAFSDLIIGGVIFSMVAKFKKKQALFSASLYLFNPVSIYNGAVWGQLDSVPTMLFIVALYFLSIRKYFISLLAVTFSFFVKLSLLPLLPLYAAFLFFHTPKKRLIAYAILMYGVVLLVILPISQNPQNWLYQFIIHNSSNVLDNVTANAYNFWWVVLMPKLLVPAITVSEKFLFASYSSWGYFLYWLLLFPLLFIVFKLQKEKITSQFLFGAFSVLSIIYFLFLPSMHERYLFSFFPLMATYIGLKGKYLKIFLVINITYMINLFSVWQYHVPEATIRANPILTNEWFTWGLSIVMTSMGLYLYKVFISENYFRMKLEGSKESQ